MLLPGFEEISESKALYAESYRLEYNEQDAVRGKPWFRSMEIII